MSRTNEANEQQLLELLTQDESLGNRKARELLSWEEDTDNLAKEGRYAHELVACGRGRGGSILPKLGDPKPTFGEPSAGQGTLKQTLAPAQVLKAQANAPRNIPAPWPAKTEQQFHAVLGLIFRKDVRDRTMMGLQKIRGTNRN
ncbi:MAG: hypothetical protein IPN62_02535 [Flavobacteriales bacterium]|nr:hypothetical protein [Flavobacteriales bacterium]